MAPFRRTGEARPIERRCGLLCRFPVMSESFEEEIRAFAQRTRAEQPQCCALVRRLRIVEWRRIEAVGRAHARSIVSGSLAGGTGTRV